MLNKKAENRFKEYHNKLDELDANICDLSNLLHGPSSIITIVDKKEIYRAIENLSAKKREIIMHIIK